MDRSNQLVDKIAHLRELNHDAQEYKSWHYEVCDTLETSFGRNSVEYRRFTARFRSWNRSASEAEKQANYLKELDEHETDLRSIIKRQEIKKLSKFQEGLIWFKSRLILKPWHWIKSHKIYSIITPIMLIAAVITIVVFVKGCFSQG